MTKRKLAVLGSAVLGVSLGICSLFTPAWPSRPITPIGPDVIADVQDPSLDETKVLWITEVSRRFHDAVFIMGHGGDLVAGEWTMAAPRLNGEHLTRMTDIIEYAEQRYPGRTVVSVSCNPAHEVLHGYPNVYYATDSVWVVPDRAVTAEDFATGRYLDTLGYAADNFQFGLGQSRWSADPTVVGSIYEFVEAK